MTDVHSSEVRSFNMSRIKGRDTKPEMIVRRFIHSKGLRYNVQAKNLPGKPDIALPLYNTTVFVHGCFWHGHRNCKYFTIPKTRASWWIDKIKGNQENDKKVKRALLKLGWKVLVVWECQLREEKKREKLLKKLILDIRSL